MSEDRVFPIISHLLNSEPLNWLRTGNLRSYMEIGVADGFTLECRLKEHGCCLEKVVLCDDWGGVDGGTNRGGHSHIADLLGRHKFPLENAIFLDGDSTVEIPRYFAKNPDEMFDFIFVDGGKSVSVASQDLENTYKHARILGLHDIRNPSHLYLRTLFYSFYETIREGYVLVDDGDYFGMLMRRDLWNWE